MARAVLVSRFAEPNTLTGERFSSYDGQGAPSYASGVSFQGVVQTTQEFMQQSDGTGFTLTLSVWVSPDADFIPDEKDRISFGGQKYIVYKRHPVRSIGTADVEHYKLVCRDE